MPEPCEIDEASIEVELCAEPSFMRTLSESGLLLVILLVFTNLQSMSTASLRWTLMLALAWCFAQHDPSLASSDVGLGVVWCVRCVLGLAALAHLPVLPRPVACGGLACAWFVRYDAIHGVLGKGDLLLVATGCAGLAALWRTCVLLLTIKATASLTMVFPLVSRCFPAFTFGDEYFFAADGCPPEVASKRKQSFEQLKLSWLKKWPKSTTVAKQLKASFSDLRFASSNRVFLPFNRVLDEAFDPATIVRGTEGVDLIDVDGQTLMDISGSYGVNVCGTERYKRFLKRAVEGSGGDLGLVLGPLSPLVLENINMLKAVSGKQEVSFHMSGTEAVMAAVRLCRFNTGKKLVVLFGGSYHGWWDGVQPSAGNERGAYDVLCLNDLDPLALQVIKLRGSRELACVVVNPLQAFHPNKPPPSDLVLMSNTRDAGDKENEYQQWLKRLEATCSAAAVPLVFDEVYTGFRLAKGGAQEYYGVEADVVVYGKTLGGGMPVGVVCGPSHLMNRLDPVHPLRCAYVIGTFSAAPVTVACMHEFLTWVKSEDATRAYDTSRRLVQSWMVDMNSTFECLGIPLRVSSYASVWTMLFTQPGRYHWFLQYLLRDEGVQLSWVGTGRLNFSFDFDEAALASLKAKLLAACRRMQDEGWWWVPGQHEALPASTQKGLAAAPSHAAFARAIKLRAGWEIARAFAASLVGVKLTIGK